MTITIEQRLTRFYTDQATDNHTVVTPLDLCYTVLSNVSSLKGTILVIANIEWLFVLRDKFNKDMRSVTFVTPCENKAIAVRTGFPEVIVVVDNLLKMDFGMKFDVVIGNPPYQHPTKKEDKLWQRFILAGVDCLTDTGSIAMITPCSWVWSLDAKIKRVKPALIDNMDLHYYNNNCNSYFTIGQNLAWFVSTKGKAYTSTTCELKDGSTDIVDFRTTHPMTVEQKLVQKIVDKIDDPKHSKLVLQQNNFPSSEVSKTKTNTHSYPCIYTTANRGFISEKKASTGILKIGFNYSSSYFSRKAEDNNMPITKDTLGELMMWIHISSQEEGKLIRNYMSSKVIRFFVENYKAGTSGFKMAVRRQKVPAISFDKEWTDAQLYKHFGLTKQEISYIETSIK